MLDSIVGNSNPKPIQAENTKLAKENRKLLQEINELREVNRKMENRWETTERDLKGVKKELKVIIDEKDNNYNKLEEEFLRVQGQLDTLLKKATSGRIYSPSATLHSKGLSASSRRTKIENLFSDENLQSGVEEQYPIWAATLKRVDERSKKPKEELQTSGDSAGSYYVDKTKSLQRKIEELEEEKAKLYLDNTKLEVLVKQKEKKKNQFIEKLTACETKLGSTEEEIRILQVSLKSSESTQKYNDSSLNRLKTKVSDLEVENLRLVEQRNELQIQADRAHREVRLAKGELEYGLKHATRPNSHGQEEYRLKNEVATLNSRIGELESQLKQSHTEIEELENQKAQAQTFTHNKQRAEELEKINDHIRQERDQLKLRLEQSLSLEAEHTKRIQELEIHLTNCYREIKEFRKENEELRLVQSEVEVLKKNLQAAQVQNEALEVRTLIAEDENKRLRESVGEEIGDEERMISNLKIAEFERMEVLQNYKRVCIENEKIKTELSEVIAAHKECLRELRDIKTEADALKLQASGPEKNEEEYFNQVAIFEELNQKLIVAESLAQEYKQAKERLDEEVIAIREEKQKLESSITEIQQTLSTNQKENSMLKAELTKLKTDHEVLREELDKKSINNEVLKGLLEDQKKNQWKYSGVQIDRRLESEESFLSANSKQESKRKGISSDRIIQFYSPQGKSDALKWEQGYKDQLKGSYRKSNGYESRLFPEEKSYWSQDLGRGINAETKPLWDSGYLKTEGDDAKKKKYGSVSLAYDKKFSKF